MLPVTINVVVSNIIHDFTDFRFFKLNPLADEFLYLVDMKYSSENNIAITYRKDAHSDDKTIEVRNNRIIVLDITEQLVPYAVNRDIRRLKLLASESRGSGNVDFDDCIVDNCLVDYLSDFACNDMILDECCAFIKANPGYYKNLDYIM